ncbi:MAG TPA: chaperone modulator CbpM [Woeseiaceae bacterium]|nr:chaperone modulator CbpM [Woeseiaceae bacterium]
MSQRSNESLRGVVLDERVTFTLSEFCQACGVETELIVEMVREGVIDPAEEAPEWRFHGHSLVRAQTALRLVRDLDVNWPGAALALDLLDELERLQRRP